jgi:hypothetical protein
MYRRALRTTQPPASRLWTSWEPQKVSNSADKTASAVSDLTGEARSLQIKAAARSKVSAWCVNAEMTLRFVPQALHAERLVVLFASQPAHVH